MNLTLLRRREPLDGGLMRLREEMERTFDRFLNEPWSLMEPKGVVARSEGWLPAVDVSETDAEFLIRAEAPGIPVKDLDISVTGSVLTISGTKEEKEEKKEENYYQCERRFGSFRRVIDLPETADADKVTAEADNGVVTIRVAKKPGARPRQVEVKPSARKVPVSG